MEISQLIKEEFEYFVNSNFQNNEVKRFLLTHERLHILVNNLTKEIKKSEHIIFSIGDSMEKKRMVVRGLIKDLSRLFCKTALDVKAKELSKHIIL